MKVQWQLVDIDTNNKLNVGEVFELVDFMERYFDNKQTISWFEAEIFFGNPTTNKTPIGILNFLKKEK